MPDTAETADISTTMQAIGHEAREAALILAGASTEAKNKALYAGAARLRAGRDRIMAANAKDLEAGRAKGLSPAMMDRLDLTEGRIESMAQGLEDIAALPDPVGAVMAEWDRPNGLRIARVRVPLGVIGVIYESRPNVTADAAALCLKSGNAAILRGGSESFHSSTAIMDCLTAALEEAGLPESCVSMVPSTDRALVGEMLRMDRFIDVIVPRGGKGLIERISAESRIPLFKHLEGVCHTYLHAEADPARARQIVVNAKMRRTGICGATETLLVDRAAVGRVLPGVVEDLLAAGCALRGDAAARAAHPGIEPATDADWSTEYLDAMLSIKVVDGVAEAVSHVNTFGTGHTEAIVTEDAIAAETFMNGVDSAIVMHNTSTQFADGGEFGMGAEIGISTGKLHARGPVGVEQLTSFKYKVRGSGQVRP